MSLDLTGLELTREEAIDALKSAVEMGDLNVKDRLITVGASRGDWDNAYAHYNAGLTRFLKWLGRESAEEPTNA